MLTLSLFLTAFSPGQVDLVLGPDVQVAPVGSTVEITLTAKAATPPTTESFTGIDAILSWDPAQLDLIDANPGSYPWFVSGFLPDPDGINLDISDGEALYTVLTNPGTPAVVPPDILVMTLRFTLLQSGEVKLIPNVGSFGKTRVLSTVPGVEITGDISATATVGVQDCRGFTDADLPDSNWALHPIYVEGSPSMLAQQQLTGGNPGSYREVSLTWGPGDVVWAHLLVGEAYDPSLSGAAEDIIVSFDLNSLAGGGSCTPPVTALGQAVIKQDGNWYVSTGTLVNMADGWTTVSAEMANIGLLIPPQPGGLCDGSVDLGSKPDLTVTGQPLQFGFLTWRCSSTSCSRTDGIDNFQVELHLVETQEVVRLGTPPNPYAFLPGASGGPVIGEAWDPVIDHTTFATSAVADLVGISLQGPISIPTAMGTLLVFPPYETPYPISIPAGTPFSIMVPSDCSLVGMPAWTQGGSFSAPGVDLANGIDVVIGTH